MKGLFKDLSTLLGVFHKSRDGGGGNFFLKKKTSRYRHDGGGWVPRFFQGFSIHIRTHIEMRYIANNYIPKLNWFSSFNPYHLHLTNHIESLQMIGCSCWLCEVDFTLIVRSLNTIRDILYQGLYLI